MLRKTLVFAAVIAVAALAIVASTSTATKLNSLQSWNPRSAAAYLDQRQAWWESWPKAARDHGTVCVSCHTAVPYALARPELRATLQEKDPTPPERRLVADVVTRVRAWNEVKPLYGDTTPSGRLKAVQSRGTESVLNALILARQDQREGVVSSDARRAFSNMFALQLTSGADAGSWAWIDFGLRPFESSTAVYFGAALAAIAVGSEPQGYARTAEIQPNLVLLRAYLRSHVDQPIWKRLLRRDNPNLFNRAMLLWASAGLPGLLSNDERNAAVTALDNAQDTDGSWKLTSLGTWRYANGVSQETAGDGFATGLIAYALEEAGIQPNEPHLSRALLWLTQHQDTASGMWTASSLNKRRDPQSNVGKFMSDAATAYAVLALTHNQP